MRNINRWLSKTGVTHLLLDGGTLSAKEGFYEDYIADLNNGERLFVVEKKTNQFRFFVDLDYTTNDDTQIDFVKVVSEISKIVQVGHCVLAKASPRKTPKGTKYGLHVVWPESVVTKQLANGIRMKILDEFGPEWEKIIDASVYSGSGLRMIWSYKNEEGSTPYVPWGRINEDGTFIEFKSVFPSVEFLELFSIRTTGTHQPITENIVNNGNSSELEQFIQKNLPGQQNARVLRISKCKNKKDFWIRTNSKYCDNVKREHKSNHVWFLLSPKGLISQRCEDDECKKYSGRFYRIPSRLIPNERVLDCGSHRHIADYLPDGWKQCQLHEKS